MAFTAHLIMLLLAEDSYPDLDASLPLRRFLPEFLHRQAATLRPPRAREEVVAERAIVRLASEVKVSDWEEGKHPEVDEWRSAFFAEPRRSPSPLSDAPVVPVINEV